PGGIGRYKPGANKALIEQYNKGTSIINFFGHGSPTTWAHESAFVIDRDLPKLRNSYRNPLVMAATCSFGLFDKPGYTAACEELITVDEVGAIGVIAANRATYSGPNYTFISYFLDSLFAFQPNTNITQSFGYAFLTAFNATGGGDNSQKYLLMCDPTLKLCGGGYKISIDSISSDTLKALSKNHIEATILNPDNSVNTDFNGIAVLTVFDAYSDYYYPFDFNQNVKYNHPGKPIFKGQYSIVNGIIEGDFIIPKSIKYKDEPSARISIYAYSEEKGSAAGYVNDLIVNGSVQGVNDSYGPSIDISFAENPGFIDGNVINSNSTIKITLEDSNGINITGESGHEIMLILDDQQTFNVTDFFLYQVDSYQKGIIEYPLTGLKNGLHTLTIKVWDNLNNLTVDETHFEVVTSSDGTNNLALYHVVNVPNPMKDETKFTFTILNNEQNYVDIKIKIFTLVGRLIKKIETTITDAPNGFQEIFWDGRDDDGDHIANGVYIYKIIIKNGDKKISKIDKLMILK
ncbi:MAG: T9SS type A sorting domain-containing protein, partial [Calditrichia bacterium]|nr:T9SS type A sorting domain-containing protein [Calditrichia bacterium]